MLWFIYGMFANISVTTTFAIKAVDASQTSEFQDAKDVAQISRSGNQILFSVCTE